MRDTNGQEPFEVQSVTKYRIRRGTKEYYTQWEGFPGQDTWEPATSFVGGDEAATAMLAKQGQRQQ